MKSPFLKFLAIAFLAFGFCRGSAAAANYYTVTVTVTNTPTNGMSLSINGTTRLWTNAVPLSPGFIQIGSDANESSTNLFNHTSSNPYTGFSLKYGSTNSIVLSGLNLSSATLSGAWGTIVLGTNALGSGYPVVVPFSGYTSTNQTNIASQLVRDLNTYSQGADQPDECDRKRTPWKNEHANYFWRENV
jgi:hypothetical protein